MKHNKPDMKYNYILGPAEVKTQKLINDSPTNIVMSKI